MALLKFLKGSLSNLPSTKTEGQVYITADSQEMYVDVDATTRISISGLRVVADEAALTALADAEGYSEHILYYVEDSQALKKYNGSTFDYLNDTTDLANLGKTVATHTSQIATLETKDTELETAINNINASTIETTTSIVVTAPVGNYKKGDVVPIDNIQSIVKDMLSTDIPASVTTAVSASISLTGSGAKEVGTSFTPVFKFSTDSGAYSQYRDSETGNMVNQSTGVTFSDYSATESGRPEGSGTGATIKANTGTFTAFTVTDGMTSSSPYKIIGQCKSTAGVVPKTYLGVDDPKNQIDAKEWTNLSTGSVYGYRKWFYGYKTAGNVLDVTKLTSDQIRSLDESDSSFGNTFTKSTTGMQQMFVAIPAGKKSDVSIANAVNGASCTVGKTSVKVEGANGYDAIAYDVWYVDNASADSGTNKYTFTLS